MRKCMEELMNQMLDGNLMDMRDLPTILAKISGKRSTAVFAVG